MGNFQVNPVFILMSYDSFSIYCLKFWLVSIVTTNTEERNRNQNGLQEERPQQLQTLELHGLRKFFFLLSVYKILLRGYFSKG